MVHHAHLHHAAHPVELEVRDQVALVDLLPAVGKDGHAPQEVGATVETGRLVAGEAAHAPSDPAMTAATTLVGRAQWLGVFDLGKHL
eukprot:5740995-Lingulodinium_polyedra.AAC.1